MSNFKLKAKQEMVRMIDYRENLYHACSTIQEYVLIATKCQAVEVQRRSGDEWTLHLFGPGDEIELVSRDI